MYVIVRKGTKELLWPNAYRTFRAAWNAIENRAVEDFAEVYQLIEIGA